MTPDTADRGGAVPLRPLFLGPETEVCRQPDFRYDRWASAEPVKGLPNP